MNEVRNAIIRIGNKGMSNHSTVRSGWWVDRINRARLSSFLFLFGVGWGDGGTLVAAKVIIFAGRTREVRGTGNSAL